MYRRHRYAKRNCGCMNQPQRNCPDCKMPNFMPKNPQLANAYVPYQELDETFKQEVKFLAESYLLYMAKETQNTTGKLDYAQYEAYMLKYRFGHYNSMNKPEYLKVVKEQIKNAFNKIAKHGEATGDELIDKHDMAAFIYALSTKSRRDESGKFLGFDIDGTISPEEYAICDNQLLSADDNLFSVKLRIAYKTLNNKL